MNLRSFPNIIFYKFEGVDRLIEFEVFEVTNAGE